MLLTDPAAVTRFRAHLLLLIMSRQRVPFAGNKVAQAQVTVMVLNRNTNALLGICILLAACAPGAVQAKRRLLTPGTCSKRPHNHAPDTK